MPEEAEDSDDEDKDLEKAGEVAEGAVSDDFWDEFDLEGEDWDEELDDYLEEGEEEDIKEIDQEVDVNEKRGNGTGDDADKISLSTVSNEAEVHYTEFDPPDLERSTAQIIPEPPWRKSSERATKLLLSCLLPFLLVGLAIYSVFKGIKAVLKVLVDLYTLIRHLVFLCIRIALFPLYLVWKLCLPAFIQAFIWEKFDERIGRRIRAALALKATAEAMVLDIPDVLWACMVAGFETCMVPCFKGLSSLWWMYCGVYIMRFFFDPVYKSTINQTVAQRKKWSQGNEDLDAAASSQALIAAKKLKKAKLKARRQKAQMIRHRRKMMQNQISLQLAEGGAKKAEDHHEVEMQDDDDRTKIKSRVMVIERRYALAVGFAWCMSGLAVFVMTVDGTKGEKCTICDEMPELGMRMCRHGEGQDCTFIYHTPEVVISVVLFCVGLMILIYSAFLYRPRGLEKIAIAEELEKKTQEDEAQHTKLKRAEDAESQVMRLLEDKLYEMTFPKRVKNCYYYSCLGDIQHYVDMCGRRLLRRALKIESRHRMRQRSIAIQDRLIFLTVGWAQWVRKKLSKCTERKPRSQEKGAGGGAAWLQQTAAGRILSSIGKLVSDTFVVRSFIYFTGIGTSQASAGDKENIKAKVVGSGKRTAGSGALKVDEVMHRFGLVKTEDEAMAALAISLEAAKSKKDFEEVVVDAGTDPVDEDVYEEPPELQDEEKHLHPSAEKEARDDEEAPEVHIG